MGLPELVGSFAVGFFLGIGTAIFYLRWKMKRQLGSLEEQMQGLMEMSDEMGGMVPEDVESQEDVDEEE